MTVVTIWRECDSDDLAGGGPVLNGPGRRGSNDLRQQRNCHDSMMIPRSEYIACVRLRRMESLMNLAFSIATQLNVK